MRLAKGDGVEPRDEVRSKQDDRPERLTERSPDAVAPDDDEGREGLHERRRPFEPDVAPTDRLGEGNASEEHSAKRPFIGGYHDSRLAAGVEAARRTTRMGY